MNAEQELRNRHAILAITAPYTKVYAKHAHQLGVMDAYVLGGILNIFGMEYRSGKSGWVVVTSLRLSKLLYGTPSASQVAQVGKAVRRLAKQGLVSNRTRRTMPPIREMLVFADRVEQESLAAIQPRRHKATAQEAQSNCPGGSSKRSTSRRTLEKNRTTSFLPTGVGVRLLIRRSPMRSFEKLWKQHKEAEPPRLGSKGKKAFTNYKKLLKKTGWSPDEVLDRMARFRKAKDQPYWPEVHRILHPDNDMLSDDELGVSKRKKKHPTFKDQVRVGEVHDAYDYV